MLGLRIPPWILLGLGSFLVKRRRKMTTSAMAQACQLENPLGSSPTNSGEDLGSTSTSSPKSVETTTKVQFAGRFFSSFFI